MTFLKNIDPYQTMDLREVLTRNYKIGTFTFASTAASGDDLYEAAFPEVLFNQAYLTDKLRDYMLFRGSVKVAFRFNTTKFAYGTFLVGYIPFYNKAGIKAWRHITLPALAQCDGTVVSVTQGEVAEITIPWVSAKPFLRIADAGVTKHGLLGMLFVRCLNPLRSATPGVPPPIIVSVYANFELPQLAGNSPAARPALIKAQSSNKIIKEAKAKQDVFAGVPEAASTVEALVGGTQKILQSVGGIAEKALPMLAMLPFDKPTIVNTPQPVFNDPDGFTQLYGRGVDVNPKAAIDPGKVLAVEPKLIGVDNGNPNLLDVIKQPSFYRAQEISNSDFTPGVFGIVIPNNPMLWVKVDSGSPNKYHPIYAAHFGMNFKYWRGSMKYVFDFRTSPLVTARVRIAHFPEQRSWTEPVDDYSGDVVSKVVDIAGDTMVEFTVPFISDDLYKPLDKSTAPTTGGSAGVIALTFETYIQGPDPAGNPTIFLNMWAAAGDDFQYMRYMTFTQDFTPANTPTVVPPPVIAQSNMRAIFKKTFEGLRPHTSSSEFGVVNGEQMLPVTDYMHRYVYAGPLTSTQSLQNVGLTWHNYPNTHALWASPFLFWRGASRIRLPQPLTGDIRITYADRTSPASDWDEYAYGVVERNALKPTPGLELPWDCPYIFLETLPTQILWEPQVWIQVPSTGKPYLYSVGDDTMLGPLSACPQWVDWNSVPEKLDRHKMIDPTGHKPTPSASSSNVLVLKSQV